MSPAPAPTTPLSLTAPVVTAAVRAASTLRGERIIHAAGRALAGRLVVPGGTHTGTTLFDVPGEHDVLVRFSRGAGLPRPLPDVHGLAVRVPDAYGDGQHQDLLLSSTAAAPLLRRLPVPVFTPGLYGSLLSYDVGGVMRMIGAREHDDRIELLIASPHGPWQPIATVTVGDELPAPQGRKIRFNVANSGGGITPVGLVQALRMRAYPASRVGPDA